MTRHRNDEAPKTIPHSFGFRPGVDLDKLNQLADELEAEVAIVTGGARSRISERRGRGRPGRCVPRSRRRRG